MDEPQLDATQPYIPEADPFRRWGRFIPITIPLLALSAAGTLLLAAHPNLELYVDALLAGTIVFLLFLLQKMEKLRGQPGYEEVRVRVFFGYHAKVYKPVDTRAICLRNPVLQGCLRIGIWLGGYALFQILVATLGPKGGSQTSPNVSYKLIAFCLILATLYICTFSILFALRDAQPWKRATQRASFYGHLLTGLVAGGIALYMVVQIPTYLFPGPPASWSTLLKFAQVQVNQENRAVELESVTANVSYYDSLPYNPQSTLFDVDFIFIGLAGRSIEIRVLDSDPPRLLERRDPWDFSDPAPTEAVLADYKQKLSKVTLGPRDVYRLTESEGLAFGREKNSDVSPHMSMYLHHDWQTWFGVPVGWNMEYETNIPGSYDSLNLRVDGATGKIVAREHRPQDFDKPLTPVPATGPTSIP